MDNISLNERFYIFDNFITSNKHILEHGDNEWEAHKIFFQLSQEHADNSPLSHAADYYESNKKIDWDYFKNINRPKEFSISPLKEKISIKERVVKSIVVDENILYLFNNMNYFGLYDIQTNSMNYINKHKSDIVDIISFDDKIISYDKDNFVVIYDKLYNDILSFKLTENIDKVVALKSKLAIFMGYYIEMIPYDNLELIFEHAETDLGSN